MIPILLILAFGVAGFTKECVLHGQTKEKKYNAWAYLFGLAVVWSLYYWAGLFNSINL